MMEKSISDEIAKVLMSIQEVNQQIANKLQVISAKKGEGINGKSKKDSSNYSELRPTN